MTPAEIENQINSLTAAMRGANVSVRSALQAQITALRAKLEAAAAASASNGNSLTAGDIDTGGGDLVVGQKIVINQTLGDAIETATLSDQAIKLYRLLSDTGFDLNDLQDFAFQLGIDWDSLPGDAKPGKARALARQCQKLGQLDRLQGLMLQSRA